MDWSSYPLRRFKTADPYRKYFPRRGRCAETFIEGVRSTDPSPARIENESGSGFQRTPLRKGYALSGVAPLRR